MRNTIVALAACVLFSTAVAAQPSDQWQETNESMTTLLSKGYTLISVISPSPKQRFYFLATMGHGPQLVAKCSEEMVVDSTPSAFPPLQGADVPPELPQMVPEFRCSMLVKEEKIPH
jgi:hypothetical protein